MKGLGLNLSISESWLGWKPFLLFISQYPMQNLYGWLCLVWGAGCGGSHQSKTTKN